MDISIIDKRRSELKKKESLSGIEKRELRLLDECMDHYIFESVNNRKGKDRTKALLELLKEIKGDIL